MTMRFTDSHEWISVEENVGTVGITNFARQELGELVYVELPKTGAKVAAGEEIAVLGSTKAAADVYAPASGTIVAVNDAAQSHINTAPETDGWLIKIALEQPADLDSLLTESDYHQLVGSQ